MARVSPSWMAFSLLVVAVGILALFDSYCRPQVVPVAEATLTPTETLVVYVAPTRPPLLPATLTPTPPPTETAYPSPLPSATRTPTPTETATPESPTATPARTMTQRG